MAWYNFHYQKGGGTIINRIFNKYDVSYVGSFLNEIKYLAQPNLHIQYKENEKKVEIKYINQDEIEEIKYLSPNKIKIKLNDNNN